MNAPVCHQAPGIIPEPAEIKMKTALVETADWPRSKPHGIIHACRRQCIRNNKSGLHPSLVTPNFYGSYISQHTALYIINGVFKMLLAALPLPALYCFIIPFLCGYHRSAFPNGIANRFFTIHILPCRTGIHHYQGMPMVGCADNHNIYVFIVEQLAIIAIGFYFGCIFTHFGKIIQSAGYYIFINVANSYEVYARYF